MPRQKTRLNSHYRRGVILGLSLAEVFLILIFLLLVVAINLTGEKQEVQKKYDHIIDRLETAIPETSDNGLVVDEIDFEELMASAEKVKTLQESIDELAPFSIIEDALSDKSLNGQELQDVLQDISAIIEKTPEDKLVKAFEYSTDVDKLTLDIKKLAKKIESMSIEKGELPPCWYTVVDRDKDPEKEIKIFDILMTDTYVTVNVRNKFKKIRAEDPSANFGDASGLPEVSDSLIGNPISYAKFSQAFYPFLKAGDNKKIQSYRCRFFIGLWDRTSTKNIFKKRLRTIENVFYKYLYSSKWPYDSSQILAPVHSPKKIDQTKESLIIEPKINIKDTQEIKCKFLDFNCKKEKRKALEAYGT